MKKRQIILSTILSLLAILSSCGVPPVPIIESVPTNNAENIELEVWISGSKMFDPSSNGMVNLESEIFSTLKESKLFKGVTKSKSRYPFDTNEEIKETKNIYYVDLNFLHKIQKRLLTGTIIGWIFTAGLPILLGAPVRKIFLGQAVTITVFDLKNLTVLGRKTIAQTSSQYANIYSKAPYSPMEYMQPVLDSLENEIFSIISEA